MKENLSSGINLGVKSNFIYIIIKYNKKNINITRYLFKKGFLSSFFIKKKTSKIVLYFSYYYNKKPIRSIKKISKPGRKVYISYKLLKKFLRYKNHYLILSTNKGILNNKEAVSNKLGGEVLFIIKC